MLVSHVALLRGINVGGKNRLAMPELQRAFVDAGATNVRTYVASGNVLFAAEPAAVAEIAARAGALVATRAGVVAPIILRSATDLADIVAANPFLGGDPGGGSPVAIAESLHVTFLAGEPAPERVASLDPDRSRPDAFAVRGREVYLLLPNGAARTRLTADYLESRLGTTGTARNWRTVTRLHELLDADASASR